MVSRPSVVAALTVAIVAAGCLQGLPGVGNGGQANAWAHEMVQADDMRADGLDGDRVVLAVVDTGVDASHEAFRNTSIVWKDFVNGQAEPYDDHGHGTHVSGLAVASSTEGVGRAHIEGIAPAAKLVHAKAIRGDGSGANAQNVADAIDWTTRQGTDVLVLSLGQAPRLLPIGNAVEDAVGRALNAGVVVVASAGNAESGSGQDCQVSSPATVPLVIAVGAVDENRSIARFSCSGGSGTGPLGVQERQHPNKKPEVTAPGVQLVGAWPGRACAGRSADYCVLSGTSQAAPIVGGLVAMMLEENPDLQREDRDTVRHIKEALRRTADKVSFSGHHNRYGYGIAQGNDALAWLANNEPSTGGGPVPWPPTAPNR